MKINKIGMVILGIIIIGCIIPIALCDPKNWFYNLSFALLGGALLSFFICITNHSIYLKDNYEKLTVLTLKSSTTIALIFDEYEDSKNIKDFLKTVTAIYLDIFNLYTLNYELIAGSFFFDIRLKKVKEIDKDLKNAIKKIFQIKCFAEKYPRDASNTLLDLYKDLKKISNTRNIYSKYLSLSKWYFSSIHSPESIDGNKYMNDVADEYKKILFSQQNDDNN